MANIVPAVINLNNVVLTIGTDNYEASVSKVELVPTTPTVTWRGMTPTATYNVAGTAQWVLNLDFAQDHATASSLSQYTLANAGTVKTVVFKPVKPASGTAPTYTIDVLITPTTIGGQVDSAATATATFNCNGQPVRTVA